MKAPNKTIYIRDLVVFLDEKIGIAQDLENESEGEARKEAHQALYVLLDLYYDLHEKFSNGGDE